MRFVDMAKMILLPALSFWHVGYGFLVVAPLIPSWTGLSRVSRMIAFNMGKQHRSQTLARRNWKWNRAWNQLVCFDPQGCFFPRALSDWSLWLPTRSPNPGWRAFHVALAKASMLLYLGLGLNGWWKMYPPTVTWSQRLGMYGILGM